MRRNFLVFLFLIFFQIILPVFSEDLSTSRSPSSEKETSDWVDQNGHDALWWAERVVHWKEKKKEAEGLLSQVEERLSAIAFQNKTLLKELVDEAFFLREIEQHQKGIKSADEMIETVLPEEARRAGAPPGWLR